VNEWTESLLKKVQETERAVRELESRLKVAREQLLLYRRLYDLETGKGIMRQEESTVQLEMSSLKHKRKPFEKGGRLSIAEATIRMLEESKRPLHGKEILEKLPAYGATAKNLNTVWGTLSNSPKLFKNIGNNRWILVEGASHN